MRASLSLRRATRRRRLSGSESLRRAILVGGRRACRLRVSLSAGETRRGRDHWHDDDSERS
eukprot:2219195-Rhodomonas_salina.1